jgi:hypothetical protein
MRQSHRTLTHEAAASADTINILLGLHLRLQVYRGKRGGSHQAHVGPLPSVHQAVLLQVGQLGETLLAQDTLEWTLPTVYTQVDL